MVFVLGWLLLSVGIILLVLGSRLYGQPKVGEQISAWRTMVPTLSEPAEHFYARLYQMLKTSLQERESEGNAPVEIVLTGMGFGPHRLFATPSLFAERPIYLLVRYQHLKYYVYAGQSPVGLYVAAWGYSEYHIGEGSNQRFLFTKRAWKYFTRQTLFQYDTAYMFIQSLQEILAQTVDHYREEEGLQPLEAMERRPILHSFYQNPFYHQQQQAPASQLSAALQHAPPNSLTLNGHSASPPLPLFAMEPAKPKPEKDKAKP